jgi:hypothetical protein
VDTCDGFSVIASILIPDRVLKKLNLGCKSIQMRIAAESLIRLKIILQTPPAGTDYALQKGSGNSYETIQTQRSTGKDLYFEFDMGMKRTKTGLTDFTGPFVQGKPGERFLYIDIGTYAGQHDSEWARRLKVPLTGIPESVIQKLAGNSQQYLFTEVPGMGKDGGPNCATVKPFKGWTVK